MVHKGNHPQMAEKIRLVKYYNLPRYNRWDYYNTTREYYGYGDFKPITWTSCWEIWGFDHHNLRSFLVFIYYVYTERWWYVNIYVYCLKLVRNRTLFNIYIYSVWTWRFHGGFHKWEYYGSFLDPPVFCFIFGFHKWEYPWWFRGTHISGTPPFGVYTHHCYLILFW